jgi:cytochrome P450
LARAPTQPGSAGRRSTLKDVTTLDPTALDQSSIHELFAGMRESGDGIHEIEGLGTLFFRYADAAKVLASPQLFSSSIFEGSPHAAYDPDDPSQARTIRAMARVIVFLDPPAHTRVRKLLQHAFTPRAIALWQATIEAVVDDVIANLEPCRGENVDFNETVAEVIPIRTISEILGVDPGDRHHFREMVMAFVDLFGASAEGEERARTMELACDLISFVEALIEQRRAHPREDLIGLLIDAEHDGEQLTTDELVASVAALLVGGSHTIVAMLGNGVMELNRHPDQLAAILADRSTVDGAVDEILRMHPAAHWTGRVASEPIEIGDRTIATGTVAWAGIASANRDPRQFADPNRFDITRHPNRHLGFGRGIHYCIGANLARLQARVAFPRIFEAFPDLSIPDGRQQWSHDFISPGRLTYPIRL